MIFFWVHKIAFLFLAIVWWFLELKNRQKSKNLFEQMRKNVSTWFFMSFHEWNFAVELCSLIQHDKKHLLALLTSSSAEIIVCIYSKVIYITWTWSPTFILKLRLKNIHKMASKCISRNRKKENSFKAFYKYNVRQHVVGLQHNSKTTKCRRIEKTFE